MDLHTSRTAQISLTKLELTKGSSEFSFFMTFEGSGTTKRMVSDKKEWIPAYLGSVKGRIRV